MYTRRPAASSEKYVRSWRPLRRVGGSVSVKARTSNTILRDPWTRKCVGTACVGVAYVKIKHRISARQRVECDIERRAVAGEGHGHPCSARVGSVAASLLHRLWQACSAMLGRRPSWPPRNRRHGRRGSGLASETF